MEILEDVWGLCSMQIKSEIEKKFINKFGEFAVKWANQKWTGKKWRY